MMKFYLALILAFSTLTGYAQLLTNTGVLTVQAATTLYVAGAVQNSANASLTSTGTVQLTGDLLNAGTLASSGTLLFTGSSSQSFVPGTASVATLVLNNTGANGNRTLTIPADLNISTALTLQSGFVRTAPTATVSLPDGAMLNGEATGRYVQGNLKIIRAAGSGTLDFGHGAILDRTGLGQVTITRTAGLLTDNLSRGVNMSNTSLKGIDRIWTVETTTSPSGTVPVTLQWLQDDDNGLTSFVQTQAWHAELNAASWRSVGSMQPATVTGSMRSFSFSTAALARLTLSNNMAPLPVTLVEFTATAQGNDALLHWSTASEKNNDHFEVEASADGQTFIRIGTIAGHGNTVQPQQYRFLDLGIARYVANPVYYRLRQVDFDGMFSYSPVRSVHTSSLANFGAQLYPSPVGATDTPQLTVHTTAAGLVCWQVTDALGRTALSQSSAVSAGTTTLWLNQVVKLAPGVYVLRVQQASHQQTIKLVRE